VFRIFRSAYVRRWLRYNALRKGLLGRQGPWLFVFVMSFLFRRLNTILKRGEMPIRFSEKLEPGVSYMISHLVPPTRRQRRKTRRAVAA